MQVSFNPQNHPKPSTLVHRKLRFLLCRITIWFIILAFWHVVAQGYLQHGDVLRHQVGMCRMCGRALSSLLDTTCKQPKGPNTLVLSSLSDHILGGFWEF